MSKKVFISYSRADYLDSNGNVVESSAVHQIVSALKAAKIEVWIDKEDHQEKTIPKKIASQIKWADTIVFLSSINSNQSQWVTCEILYAFNAKKTIIPIQLDQCSYNDDFDLLLAKSEHIEYYKNSDNAVTDLLLRFDEKPVITKTRKTEKVIAFFKLVSVCIAILIGTILMFFSVGIGVGYYQKRVNAEELLNESFSLNKIYIHDKETIYFENEQFPFIYNVVADEIKYACPDNQAISQNLSVENILSSAAISIAFAKLLKGSKSGGNGKTRIIYIVVGSIGILCGYSVGYNVGELIAHYKNAEDLKDYIKDNREVKQKMEGYLKRFYLNEY